MINHAIGASGVVNQQCKSVVEKYGGSMMDLLSKEVGILPHSTINTFSCVFASLH